MHDIRQPRCARLIACGFLAWLFLLTAPAAAMSSASVACPLSAGELSTIVGRQMQRVNLSGPGDDPLSQCAFAVVAKSGKVLPSPQVFVTVGTGGAADLRELYAYYVRSRAKLPTRPQVESRPDLGSGAFTLTSSSSGVTTAFFLVGKSGLATALVDLDQAAQAKRDSATADRILTLLRNRLR